MFNTGISQPSDSSYASLLHLVLKSNLKIIFSKLDLTKSFYQVPVADEDIPKTQLQYPLDFLNGDDTF